MSSRGVIDLRAGPPRRARRAAPPPPPRDQRPLPLRARRRRARTKAFLALACCAALLAYGIHWASYLPQYSIRSIYVQGTHRIDATLVGGYAESVLYDGSSHFLSRQNMFVYPREVIERDVVANFPVIKSAHISRPSFMATAITISITERGAYARWCTGAEVSSSSACYFLDDSGFVFAQDDGSTISTHYTFSGGLSASSTPIGKVYAASHLRGLVSLLDTFGQEGYVPLGAFVENNQDFTVYFADGSFLKASFGTDADELVRDLELVLNSDVLRDRKGDIEYIDLRFGNKVYYKLKGEEATTVQ